MVSRGPLQNRKLSTGLAALVAVAALGVTVLVGVMAVVEWASRGLALRLRCRDTG